jgi:hypothetical protein
MARIGTAASYPFVLICLLLPACLQDVLTAACMLDGSELCQIAHELEVAAVLAGPGQGATVLVDTASRQQQEASRTRQLTGGFDADEVHGGVQSQVQSEVQQASAGMQREFHVLLQEGLAFDVHGASAEQRIAAAAALAAASAARGSGGDILTSSSSSSKSNSAASASNGGHFHYKGGVLRDKAGVDVSKHLSEVKRVSAVMNVDPQEFKRYLLTAFRQ